ncbi:hypothetical protein [Methylobacterium sp.]|uniref:hypothetical protein n=1 Tax=Methylobacterium sp. TaxID=409 RepID=UPI000C36B9A9|nr:hypothetical protein [Methylobacterium sp.]MBP28318.1 hypothetical protein [Methylobacterium sp.]RUP16214.1 MAG: hypothetical protein EKK43_02950 [Methylobacterium sp.]
MGGRAGAVLAGALVVGLGLAPVAAAAQMPTRVGTCVATTISRIGTRFSDKLVKPKGDGIDEGTSVDLKNGVYGVSYAYIDAIARSRVGDRVMTCLVALPTGCPKGDDRGKMYTTTNLRTLDSWTLPDSQHMCGGA